MFCKYPYTHTHTLSIQLQYYRLRYISYTEQNLLEIEFGTTRHALKRRAIHYIVNTNSKYSEKKERPNYYNDVYPTR